MRTVPRALQSLCFSLLIMASVHAQTVRDPMRPPGVAPAASRPRAISALKLEGVITGSVRVAIVNGRLVRAGDEIGGAQILEVLHDGVRYSRAGQVHSLLLPGARASARPGVRVASSPEAKTP